MIKVEVLEPFTLKKFDELKNIERVNSSVEGQLFMGDKFECTKEMADYLTGNNTLKKVVVKVLEVEPIKEVATIEEVKPVEETLKEKKPKKKKKK